MKSHFHSNYFVLCIWAIVFLVLVGCNNTLQKKQCNLLGNETIDLSKTKDVISFSTPQKGGKGVEKTLTPSFIPVTQEVVPTNNSDHPKGSKYFELIPEAISSLKKDYYILFLEKDNLKALSPDGKTETVIAKVTGSPLVVTYDGKLISATDFRASTIEILDMETLTVKTISMKREYADSNNCHFKTVSPNLKWVVIECFEKDLGLIFQNVEDEQEIRLSREVNYDNLPESFLSLSWSPDNNWLVYYRVTNQLFQDMHGTAELILVDVSCLGISSKST